MTTYSFPVPPVHQQLQVNGKLHDDWVRYFSRLSDMLNQRFATDGHHVPIVTQEQITKMEQEYLDPPYNENRNPKYFQPLLVKHKTTGKLMLNDGGKFKALQYEGKT